MCHRLGIGTQKTGKLKKKKKKKRRPILFPCFFRLHITFFLIRPRSNTSRLDTNITEFLSIASDPKCFHAILIKGLRDDCPNFKSHILGLFVLFSSVTPAGTILKKGQMNCSFLVSGQDPIALFQIKYKKTVGCHHIKGAIRNSVNTEAIPRLLVRKSRHLRIRSYCFMGSSAARQALFYYKCLRHTNKVGRCTHTLMKCSLLNK